MTRETKGETMKKKFDGTMKTFSDNYMIAVYRTEDELGEVSNYAVYSFRGRKHHHVFNAGMNRNLAVKWVKGARYIDGQLIGGVRVSA